MRIYYSSKTITSQEQFDLFIRNLNFPKLSDEDRDEIEGPLTLEGSVKQF